MWEKLLIDKLKRQKNKELQKENVPEDWCSKSDRGDIVSSLEKIIASELDDKEKLSDSSLLLEKWTRT